MTHEFHPLRVAAVRRDTSESLSIALAVPPEAREEFRFLPGQHLVIRKTLGGEEVRRSYSITSGPADRDLWINIKRVPGGAFSTWAHGSLQPGGTLDCMPPAGRFVLPASDGAPRRVIGIAAGSGITPVIAILEHTLATEPDSRATLIYGSRAVDQIIFRERLDDLKDRTIERLQVFHVLSRDTEADVPLLAGRIDGQKIRAILSGAALPGAGDHVFLCGPDTLIKEARDSLLALGVPRQCVHFEYFKFGPQMTGRRTVAELQPAGTEPIAVDGAEVVAVVDGLRKTFRVGEGQQVIEAALAAGIRLPYSCRGGMCCTCRAKVVEGQVTMDRNFSLEPWELEAGFVLTCQSRPTTSRVVLDYDQV